MIASVPAVDLHVVRPLFAAEPVGRHGDAARAVRIPRNGRLEDAAGDAGMASGNPYAMAIGAALKTGAGMTRKDMTLSSPYASSSGNAGANQQSSDTSEAAGMFGKQMTDIISGIYNGRKADKGWKDSMKPSVWQSLAGGKNG